MALDIRYARSGGLAIAYQVVGEGETDLLCVPGWVSNLVYGWEIPQLRAFYERLAESFRLILFDKRGTGLSDLGGHFPALETRMDDVRAVLDAAGAGERDRLHPFVLDEHVADLGRRAGDDVQPSGGQARFLLELGEQQRRERRLACGLEHDCAARRKRRCELVRDEVEREVERRDRADDPDRQPQRQRQLPLACCRALHRHHLACEAAGLECREGEGRRGTLGLDSRSLERLAGLGGDGPRRLFDPLLEQRRDPVEDPRPLVRGERLLHRGGCGVDRPSRLVGAASGDAAQELAGER